LRQLRRSLQALRELQKLSYEEFVESFLYTSTAERQLQLAIQACIDVGEHVLAELMTEPPEDYASVFLGLAAVEILPAEFAGKLAEMARFRNILVHLYLELDLKKVYSYLQEDLNDFDEFVAYVASFIDQYKQ
jgi:uncharacterized protein YutE (UPF0331/DUF86 family)